MTDLEDDLRYAITALPLALQMEGQARDASSLAASPTLIYVFRTEGKMTTNVYKSRHFAGRLKKVYVYTFYFLFIRLSSLNAQQLLPRPYFGILCATLYVLLCIILVFVPHNSSPNFIYSRLTIMQCAADKTPA